MKPITRKEYYLAKAAGTYTGPTPPPVLREDYYLATLAGDYSGYCPAPVTRIEKYMSAAAGLTSYIPQPVTRIEKYWYAIAKGTGYVPEPVTREEKFLYAVLKNPPKPEYLDKTAEGNPILLTDSAEAPLTALTLYGHSTQDGTPSPDNPVPIVSAGSVMTTGAQLFDFENADIVNMYIANSGIGDYVSNWSVVIPISPNTGYTISEKNQNTIRAALTSEYPYDGIQALYKVVISQYDDIVIPSAYEANYLMIQLYGDFVDEPDFSGIMLNAGSTALPWEPYTGGVPGVNPYAGEINVSVSDGGTQSQTLTLSTPGGLPGIPVSSGGNYTDESGQQWICDEIDLARGKYVQRVGSVLADGTVNKFTASADNVFWNLNADHTAPGVISGKWYLSIYFSKDFFKANESVEFIYVTSEKGQEYFDTIEDLNAFCVEKNAEGNPLIIYYPMDPIETDLPAEEIAAYKSLHTYTPNTTVSNDAEAWMKVGYKATP